MYNYRHAHRCIYVINIQYVKSISIYHYRLYAYSSRERHNHACHGFSNVVSVERCHKWMVSFAKARWAPPCCWKMASWKWRSQKRSVTPNSKSEWWLAQTSGVGILGFQSGHPIKQHLNNRAATKEMILWWSMMIFFGGPNLWMGTVEVRDWCGGQFSILQFPAKASEETSATCTGQDGELAYLNPNPKFNGLT